MDLLDNAKDNRNQVQCLKPSALNIIIMVAYTCMYTTAT